MMSPYTNPEGKPMRRRAGQRALPLWEKPRSQRGELLKGIFHSEKVRGSGLCSVTGCLIISITLAGLQEFICKHFDYQLIV